MTLAGRRRTVVEDMTQMTAAAAAVHFGAYGKQAAVDRRGDGIGQRRGETRPAGAAVVLRRRGVVPAGCSRRSGKTPVRCSPSSGLLPARSVPLSRRIWILLRRQQPAPFGVGLDHLERCRGVPGGEPTWSAWAEHPASTVGKPPPITARNDRRCIMRLRFADAPSRRRPSLSTLPYPTVADATGIDARSPTLTRRGVRPSCRHGGGRGDAR